MGKTPTARSTALALIARVLDGRRPLEEASEEAPIAAMLGALDPRDRRYAFALVSTALRQLGRIDDLLARFIDKALPPRSGPTQNILRLALADLLFLKAEPYAAVHAAVEIANADAHARHFRGLTNAVLRRAAKEGAQRLTEQDVAQVLLPLWLDNGWRRAYGDETAEAIIRSHTEEPPLDLTLRPDLDVAEWAEQLGARILPTGTLRLDRAGRIQDLPGFEDGAWWVQDAAAALPARLLGNVSGRTILDLCAAPGGKTAWLAAAGAHVVAVDKSPERIQRLASNLARLRLPAEIVTEDARGYRPEALVSGVLLDAPCSSTGTIRRHPDLPWIKEPDDIRALALLQAELLAAAFGMLEVGGTLIYSVCSIEPEEGPDIVAALLAETINARRLPIIPGEIPGAEMFITEAGDLRTLPCQWREHGGIDGFYAARLTKAAA